MIPRRPLGRTGLDVSVLSLGAGPIPALMTGDTSDVQRAVLQRALQHGINWIDTAASYGDGRSEQNLGDSLRDLGALDGFHLATKVRLMPDQLAQRSIRDIVRDSVTGSLKRLGVERLTLLQLHNSVTGDRGDLPTSLTAEDVLGPQGVCQAMQELQDEGIVDHLGLTGLGPVSALRELIASDRFATLQVPYHLLNPTAGQPAVAGWTETDHGQIIDDCANAGMGVFAIRVYAGGAILGRPPAVHTYTTRFFPLDLYQRDARRAADLAATLPASDTPQRAAVRFVVGNRAVTSAIIGFSETAHVDAAVAALPSGL
ncbi:MAG: aldo/keto reductase [Planctomycetaceae bacterium]